MTCWFSTDNTKKKKWGFKWSNLKKVYLQHKHLLIKANLALTPCRMKWNINLWFNTLVSTRMPEIASVKIIYLAPDVHYWFHMCGFYIHVYTFSSFSIIASSNVLYIDEWGSLKRRHHASFKFSVINAVSLSYQLYKPYLPKSIWMRIEMKITFLKMRISDFIRSRRWSKVLRCQIFIYSDASTKRLINYFIKQLGNR